MTQDELKLESLGIQWNLYERSVNNYSIIMRILNCLENKDGFIKDVPKIFVEESPFETCKILKIGKNTVKEGFFSLDNSPDNLSIETIKALNAGIMSPLMQYNISGYSALYIHPLKEDLNIIGFLVLGFANSLWMLFLARIIDGLSGANISTAQAVISDSTNEKTRTQGLGLVGAAFGLGFVVGPVIAALSLAVSHNNYQVPAFVAAGFSLLSILLTSLLLTETLSPGSEKTAVQKRSFSLKAFWEAMNKPLVGILLALMFLQQVAFGGFQQLLSLFTLNRLGISGSGNAVLFVFVGIVIVAVQGYFIGKWSRKFGEVWLIRFGLGMLTLGLLLTALTPHQAVPWYNQQAVTQELSGGRSLAGETPPTSNLQVSLPSDTNKGVLGLGWILIAMIPVAMGGGVLQPSINSLLTRRVSPAEVGGTLGISAALLSGANSVAPVVGGELFQVLGSSAPFLLGAAITVILFFVAMKTLNPKADQKIKDTPGGM